MRGNKNHKNIEITRNILGAHKLVRTLKLYKQIKSWHIKTDLGGDEGEVPGIGSGLGSALPPVEEAAGIVPVARDAEGVNEAGGEHRLPEAVGAAVRRGTYGASSASSPWIWPSAAGLKRLHTTLNFVSSHIFE